MSAIFRKIVCAVQVFVFAFTSLILPNNTYAQSIATPALPLPAIGEAVNVSQAFTPVLIKGLTMDERDPLKFEFLMDQGDSNLQGDALKAETYKLIKYFMASLTTPEQDLWVNLSPYEKDRIIPETLGQTEMGRDLLSQDYILKQLTATLMSPEGKTGKKFWEKVYEKIYEDRNSPQPPLYIKRGSAQRGGVIDPSSDDVLEQTINSFNKVWIVPQTGYFYEHNNSVLITDAKLKVMLEEDYVAAQKAAGADSYGLDSRSETTTHHALRTTDEVKEIIRTVIIPIIEDEVNNGENFASLRQVYNAMLLAVWFKKRIKGHVLSEVYVDRRKVAGIDLNDKSVNEAIWQRYVDTFKSGVSNIIRDEYDPTTQSLIPKKYFVGGAVGPKFDDAQMANQASLADIGHKPFMAPLVIGIETSNPAMLVEIKADNLADIISTLEEGLDVRVQKNKRRFSRFKLGTDQILLNYQNSTLAMKIRNDQKDSLIFLYDPNGQVIIKMSFEKDGAGIERRGEFSLGWERPLTILRKEDDKLIVEFRHKDIMEFLKGERGHPVFSSVEFREGDSIAAADSAMMSSGELVKKWIQKHVPGEVLTRTQRAKSFSEHNVLQKWVEFVVFSKNGKVYTQLLGVKGHKIKDLGLYQGNLEKQAKKNMRIPDLEESQLRRFLDQQESKKLSKKIRQKEIVDLSKKKSTGGVNLRSDQADLRFEGEENGFEFPKYDPTMPMMPLQRLVPVMMDLKFITIADAAMKLGLAVPENPSSDNASAPVLEKARELEPLASL